VPRLNDYKSPNNERELSAFLDIITLAEEIKEHIDYYDRKIHIWSMVLGTSIGLIITPIFLKFRGLDLHLFDPILFPVVMLGLVGLGASFNFLAKTMKQRRRERTAFKKVIVIADELLAEARQTMTSVEFARVSIRLSRLDN